MLFWEIKIPTYLVKKQNIVRIVFFTAVFAKASPKSIIQALNNKHEIGCHGYNHFDFYDKLSLKQQIDLLKKSKDIIENISGVKIVSFRAPCLRINKNTVKALCIAGVPDGISACSLDKLL